MRQGSRPGQVDDRPTRPARRGPPGQSSKTFEIVIGVAVGALVLLGLVTLLQMGGLRRELAGERARAKGMGQSIEALRTDFADVQLKFAEATDEVESLRAKVTQLEAKADKGAGSDAELDAKIEAAVAKATERGVDDIRRGVAQVRDRIARDLNPQNFRTWADEARKRAEARAQAPEGETPEAAARRGRERDRAELEAKGADVAAKGIEDWQSLRKKRDAGEMTQAEFEKAQRELATKARENFMKNLTPEQRKRIEEMRQRFGGGRRGGRRRPDGGGGDRPAGGGGDAF
ncbi:MAG: hypothetical protein ACYS9X_31320 [Planctomycetota bacterium]|jgi:chromosome segregation ATPase